MVKTSLQPGKNGKGGNKKSRYNNGLEERLIFGQNAGQLGKQRKNPAGQ
jgi:hypothetical protein